MGRWCRQMSYLLSLELFNNIFNRTCLVTLNVMFVNYEFAVMNVLRKLSFSYFPFNQGYPFLNFIYIFLIVTRIY